MSLVIVGSVAFDTIRTPWGDREKIVGGSVPYCSLAASFFTRPRMVGVVGRDFPRKTIALLKSRGVDLRGLRIKAGKTMHWEGKYEDDPNKRSTLRTELNVFGDFRPEIPPAYRNSSIVYLANINPAHHDFILQAVPQARSGGHGHDPPVDRHPARGPAQGTGPGEHLLRQRRGGPVDHRGIQPDHRREGPHPTRSVPRPAQEGRARGARLRPGLRLRRPGPSVRARHRPDRGGGQLRRRVPRLSRRTRRRSTPATSAGRPSTAASWLPSPSRTSASGGSRRSIRGSSRPASGSSAS